MNLEIVETWIWRLGGLAAFSVLAVSFLGIWRGLRRPPGRTSGRMPGLLHSPLFYLLASTGFFGICYLLWQPLPLSFAPITRIFFLICGGLLVFPGLAFILWGRLALGRQYFVSTSLGAQLYQDHQLITSGPYALVRHPMYFGLIMASFGGILVYRTWTLVFLAFSFLGIPFRAWREDQALAEEFGSQWQEYRQHVPFLIPFLTPDSAWENKKGWHPGQAALLEILILFLPAIPAYLWIWPNLSGLDNSIVQDLVYLYVLGGSLFIGLRRWSWSQLGFNKDGIWLSLTFGLIFLIGRLMIILSVQWTTQPVPLSLLSFIGDILYYIGLVGLVEELLFRGLLYRALEGWLGLRWAIWGSSIGFVLWHTFGQGVLVGLAMLLIGLVFALFRWRTGSILGIIFIHGLYDLETIFLVGNSNAEILGSGQPGFSNVSVMLSGWVFMIFVPIYLWLIHPYFQRRIPSLFRTFRR